MISLDKLRKALAAQGLILRGGFNPEDGDDAPTGAATILLVGNAGPAMWSAFAAVRVAEPDPLNSWTRRVVGPIAKRFGATATYPFDGPPYRPFLRWAQRSENLHQSPLGMLIHPEYGLWHAWRAALCFPQRFDLPARESAPSPCERCEARPCLSACPVSAFSSNGYDTAACSAWMRGTEGADCRNGGCRARHACPVGGAFRYVRDQATLHMASFLDGQPDAGLRLRAYRETDAGVLARLFHDSVHRAAPDYTPDQRRAWSPAPPDAEVFHTRLAAGLTAVAECGGVPCGFATLLESGHIDMFYCHADRQGQGVGKLLYRRLEGAARQRGDASLTTDASITARPFFERMGFAVTARQTVTRNDVELTNFAMAKKLTP